MSKAKIALTRIDHVHSRLDGDASALAELSDHLTFEVPGAKFDPRYKSGRWNGMLKLIHWRDRTVHAGLEDRIRTFCQNHSIELLCDTKAKREYSKEVALDHMRGVGIPDGYEVRPYQVEAIRQAMSSDRMIFVSPTSSGKSFIIHMIARWYGGRCLIIVPSTGLTEQFRGDLIEYGLDPGMIRLIGGGHKAEDDYPQECVVVSTWQSLVDQPEVWFDQFKLVVGDEVHRFAAKSLIGIMEKTGNVPLRFGFTGTLDGSKCHQFQLEGLFGPVHTVTTTRELMDEGYVADLSVHAIVLSHPTRSRRELKELQDEARKKKRGNTGAIRYAAETKFLYESEERNRFIVKLASRLKGNTLVLFHQIDHGDELFDRLVTETDRPVHLINGGVKGLLRNDIRGMIEESDDAILLASVGTTSTGVSIRRINNVVLASPWKSQIITLQSVGRGLRNAHDKNHVDVYDLGDDLSMSRKMKNHTLKHMEERISIYERERFDYKIVRLDL